MRKKPSKSSQRPTTRNRHDIDDRFKWNLSNIYEGWEAWDVAYKTLTEKIDWYQKLKGTLSNGPESLLEALRYNDELDELSYRVWYYPALHFDEDQRDNDLNAKRQQVQILMARWQESASWFHPELLAVSFDTVQMWMRENKELAKYRFYIESLYRQQEHVLDEAGERLMSLTSRLGEAPGDTYSALSTADIRYPTVTLSHGEETVVSYGRYREILATCRERRDRMVAFEALHEVFKANLNTYAALYSSVLQRDWFHAQARGYRTTLEAALHGNNIPPSVVENLISSTRASVDPLRRYHRLRKRSLGLDNYHVFDFSIPLVETDETHPYSDAVEGVVESSWRLGEAYQDRVREAFKSRWIDVYENDGKRSGAYSAPVYGVHPYMLLNYNDTLDSAFTLAHEMGHSIHTMLAHESQPIRYAGYTIFVAEVPSTLAEVLFLEYMLERTTDPKQRIVLLQHAIDNITGTFYSQVLFADYELQAHRLVEEGKAVTADVLTELYGGLLDHYYADALDANELSRMTWARVPHFFNSPYYVYQYATCFASAAKLGTDILSSDMVIREAAVDAYFTLLKAGGSAYPMDLLRQAGVDLSRPETVQAVSYQLEQLVSQLEIELKQVGEDKEAS